MVKYRFPSIIQLAALVLLALLHSAAIANDQPLAGEIATLKKDVIELQRDLATLEQELLFPDNTRINVFLSVDSPGDFVLESVELLINDQVVASHVYKPAEIKALTAGAIQPLYRGNLVDGKHRLVARMRGRRASAPVTQQLDPLDVDKTSRALFVELSLSADAETRDTVFQVRTWD